ncbi:MAG: glycosyltransferase family 4 protein [Planctomycetales bacterium]|nr:glycosyltransferase family 4 protein [Planctomycetales bacterium]
MSRPVRILMLLENNPYSRDGRVRREARALIEAGYQVSVICPRAPHQARREKLDGVEAYQYSPALFGYGKLGYVIEYAHAMLMTLILTIQVYFTRGFDVLHAHNPPDLFVLIAILFRPLGKKFVFDHHDLASEMFRVRFHGNTGIVYRLLRFFERLSCRWADCVVATNESYKRLEVERAGVPAERITVVRNGPAPRHFEMGAPHPSLVRPGQIVIGFVGEMGKQDGLDYLMRSLRNLRHKLGRSDWICALVGEGEKLDELRSMAGEFELTEHMFFVGRVKPHEVVEYVRGMDICVVPDPSNSYTDHCTMIKVMEYMAQAKPIVCFDLPETRHSAQGAAVYVEPNDEIKFARALVQLMDDPDERRRLGEEGFERAVHHLAWRHEAPKLIAMYDRMTGRPGNARRNTKEDARELRYAANGVST